MRLECLAVLKRLGLLKFLKLLEYLDWAEQESERIKLESTDRIDDFLPVWVRGNYLYIESLVHLGLCVGHLRSQSNARK
ncbi:hypothetical protein D3C77_168940 [compost metagenome]